VKKSTLDTDIITAFLKNDNKVVEKVSIYLESFEKLNINIIAYYEILRGLKDLGNKNKLKKFEEFISENKMISLGKEAAEKASDIYASLKKKGSLIQDADILIAAIAMTEDLVLVTNNTKHFNRINGLKLENWLE
jgi:tRNA(fMet)-specific endonuclease VapC